MESGFSLELSATVRRWFLTVQPSGSTSATGSTPATGRVTGFSRVVPLRVGDRPRILSRPPAREPRAAGGVLADMRPRIAAVLLLLAPTLLALHAPATTTTCCCAARRPRRRRRADPAGAGRAPTTREAYYVRHLLASGFGAELLRTYAMTKRFAARDRRLRATPTTIALGAPDARRAAARRARACRSAGGARRSTATRRSSGSTTARSARERSTMVDLVSAFGGAIVDVIAPETGAPHTRASALREGYIAFLQVVRSEWRPPRATDDRDELRRLRRRRARSRQRRRAGRRASADESTWVMRDRQVPQARPAEMVGDPLVVATVLYRLASSELGQRMADPAVYRPFLEARPPHDVHPALLLGAFRNFQAKLLAAWRRAAPPDTRPTIWSTWSRRTPTPTPPSAPRRRASSWSRPTARPRCATACTPSRRTRSSASRPRCCSMLRPRDVLFGAPRPSRDGYVDRRL